MPTRELPSFLVRPISCLQPELRGLAPELGRRNDVSAAKARRMRGFAPRPARDTIADSAAYLLTRPA